MQILRGTTLFSGKIFTARKKFTWLPVATNFKSVPEWTGGKVKYRIWTKSHKVNFALFFNCLKIMRVKSFPTELGSTYCYCSSLPFRMLAWRRQVTLSSKGRTCQGGQEGGGWIQRKCLQHEMLLDILFPCNMLLWCFLLAKERESVYLYISYLCLGRQKW